MLEKICSTPRLANFCRAPSSTHAGRCGEEKICATPRPQLMPVCAATKKSAPRHDFKSCRSVRRRKNLRHATTSTYAGLCGDEKICATPRPQLMPVSAATKKICATPRPQLMPVCAATKKSAPRHDWQIFAGHLARLMPVGAAKKKICATPRLANFRRAPSLTHAGLCGDEKICATPRF